MATLWHKDWGYLAKAPSYVDDTPAAWTDQPALALWEDCLKLGRIAKLWDPQIQHFMEIRCYREYV